MNSQFCRVGRAAYYRAKFGPAAPGRGPDLTARQQAIIHFRNAHPHAALPGDWA